MTTSKEIAIIVSTLIWQTIDSFAPVNFLDIFHEFY